MFIMCFHNSLSVDEKQLAKRYAATIKSSSSILPVFHANAFNFQPWIIVSDASPDILQEANWGLIPSWVKSPEEARKIRINTLNARIESVFEKPSFKDAAHKRHCLVPSTGFFEWQTLNNKKYPYFIYLKNELIFSMAGIWETYKNPITNEDVCTFSILTTEANPLLAKIHNTKQRMPVILAKEDEHKWLHGEFSESALQSFSIPFDEKQMLATTVSNIITQKESNVPKVQEPFQYPIFLQTSLF